MSKFKHVAVLFGGWSAERDVSLASGQACAGALRESGYQVTEIDVKRDLAAQLTEIKPDACFNALHGIWGEDGCVQGVLEVLDIPYTHSGVMASSLAMNKSLTKRVLKSHGVPVADEVILTRSEAAKAHALPPPYVIKPVTEGSSVGILLVNEGEGEIPSEKILALGPADQEVMVEKFVAGQELTCAVMGGKALDVMEILPNPSQPFYDYDAKYAPGGSDHLLPAQILPNINEIIQKWSGIAHSALGCRGVSRVDFRYDAEKQILACLEVNTQPGMTATSLVPEIAAASGFSFNDLVRWIVEDASCRR